MSVGGDYTATLPRKRLGAGVLFTNPVGAVLLVEPVYKNYWELVGGSVDENESPWQAAAREVREELGKPISPGRLLAVDWVPPRPHRTEGVMFVFDGGVLDDRDTIDIHLPADELRSWAWCTETQVWERMSEPLARRVAAALRAKITGATVNLENGFEVP